MVLSAHVAPPSSSLIVFFSPSVGDRLHFVMLRSTVSVLYEMDYCAQALLSPVLRELANIRQHVSCTLNSKPLGDINKPRNKYSGR